jgi:flagellar L-ring protein precursor FlgH
MWSDENPNPILDPIATKVGDVITIVIREFSDAEFSASTSLSKDDYNFFKVVFNYACLKKLLRPGETMDKSHNEGTGETLQNSKLSARLTAVVTKVLPGDRLAIEAERTIMINKEFQTFVVSGVIRRRDITANNTILSERIADAEIRMSGRGAINDRQRRGILTRIVDWLF